MLAHQAPRDADDALKISTSQTPEKPPPFAALPIQPSWDYSDLVCTGSAEEPTRTGRIEILGGAERDQLAANVTFETCFKGAKPSQQIRVIGDSPFAEKNIKNGYVWAGPPPGFVARGRNLLFLRKTGQPDTWRVTVPVYENSIQLVDIPPAYVVNGSDDSIRRALVAEMEAMIQRGEVRLVRVSFNTPTKDTAQIASQYLRYIVQILGRSQAMCEFARLLDESSPGLRRQVAMQLLWADDQRGVRDSLELLEDTNVLDWQRANAARALQNATAPEVRSTLEQVVRESKSNEIATAARESLSRMPEELAGAERELPACQKHTGRR